MYGFTYSSLLQTVEDFVQRNDADFTAILPTLIMLAQRRIAKECPVLGLQNYVTGEFTAGLSVYPFPARWRRTISLNAGNGPSFNNRNQIYERPLEYVQQYTVNPIGEMGFPKYYAIYGYNNFVVAPTPDANYPFEMAFYETPMPISETNQTNWVTDNAPELLLYAVLLEAMPYLKNNEAQFQLWQQMYQQSAAAFMQEDAFRNVDRQVILPGTQQA